MTIHELAQTEEWRAGHVPVLVEAVADLLGFSTANEAREMPRVVLDSTVGRGGHAAVLIERMKEADRGGVNAACRYIGLDLDAENVDFARARLAPLAKRAKVELVVQQASFAQAPAVLAELAGGKGRAPTGVDAVLTDLGFASNQLADARRGLSFQDDGPLDMRLDTTGQTMTTTAAELVNTLSEQDLADVIHQYGEERLSRRIAKKIVERRRRSPINSTGELADIVRQAYGPRGRQQKIDPATRTFMALRIAVNDELHALDQLLADLPMLLNPGGRAALISFHSLEDRRVKRAFLEHERQARGRRLTRKPITADDVEQQSNPRSRSAKLRGWRRSSAT